MIVPICRFTLLLGCCGAALLTGCVDDAVDGPGGPSFGKVPATLAVNSVNPDSVTQDTTLDVHVFGSGFDASAQVDFLLNSQPDSRVRTNATRFVKSTEVVANITVALNAVPAKYDTRVTLLSSGKKGIGTELLAVLPFADLGDLGGGSANAAGVNDEGSVAGRSEIAGTTQGHAYLWDARTGTLRDLGTLEAYAVNNNRSVSGLKSGIGPVRWDYDGVTDQWTWTELPSPLGDDAFPLDINQGGAMAGWADGLPGGTTGAVLWPNLSTYVALDPARRWAYSQAHGLNGQGWVAGYGRNAVGNGDAWVWIPQTPGGSSGTLVSLPRFGALPDHHAEGINDAGDVVGWAESAQGVDYALLWRRNQAVTDPTAPNAYFAPIDLGAALKRRGRALDINNAGRVVGRADPSSNRFNYDPFVWDAASGMRILPKPSGGDAVVGRISDGSPAIGAGSAMVGGSRHAIRWQLP